MILFHAEHLDGAPRKNALELARAAADLASATGADVTTDVVAVVVGGDAGVAEAMTAYAPRVLHAPEPDAGAGTAEARTAAVTAAAKALGATVVLLPASRAGLAVAPRVAMRLGAPLLEDATSLRAAGDALLADRFTFLARVTETVRAAGDVVVASLKPNAWPVHEGGAGGSVEPLDVAYEDADRRVEVRGRDAAKGGRVALEEADVVVTGGRGVGGPEGFERLVEPLADATGGGVGATRAVVDAGWRPYGEQVGQTGKTVSPSLYLALAVSGAVQHLSGMNRSKVIVAINKDADAPIFKVADYGIVGDVNEVVPALVEALKAG